ncbi:acetolactate synthase [Colletotrichum higginsianum]|nr:acetolactate synthase [Colletotrichum higginsianum]
MMLRSRQAARALKAVSRPTASRALTTSSAVSAIQAAKKVPSGVRNQATSATSPAPEVRSTPAPAFNADKDRSHVQPLVGSRGPEMDESYVAVAVVHV